MQEGQGEMVARECTCGEEPDDMCPAHLLWDQVTDRRMALQKIGSVEGTMPLFVGQEGNRITSKEILEAITTIAREAGENITDDEGRARFGTHSMTVAGALAAFCAGIDEPTIRRTRKVEIHPGHDDVFEGDAPRQSICRHQGDVPGHDSGMSKRRAAPASGQQGGPGQNDDGPSRGHRSPAPDGESGRRPIEMDHVVWLAMVQMRPRRNLPKLGRRSALQKVLWLSMGQATVTPRGSRMRLGLKMKRC